MLCLSKSFAVIGFRSRTGSNNDFSWAGCNCQVALGLSDFVVSSNSAFLKSVGECVLNGTFFSDSTSELVGSAFRSYPAGFYCKAVSVLAFNFFISKSTSVVRTSFASWSKSYSCRSNSKSTGCACIDVTELICNINAIFEDLEACNSVCSFFDFAGYYISYSTISSSFPSESFRNACYCEIVMSCLSKSSSIICFFTRTGYYCNCCFVFCNCQCSRCIWHIVISGYTCNCCLLIFCQILFRAFGYISNWRSCSECSFDSFLIIVKCTGNGIWTIQRCSIIWFGWCSCFNRQWQGVINCNFVTTCYYCYRYYWIVW